MQNKDASDVIENIYKLENNLVIKATILLELYGKHLKHLK